MKFAVLADIHGNADALRAVLDDMAALGLQAAVNLGDCFSGPLDAGATADLLLARGFPAIRGNHDRYLIEQAPDEMGPSDRTAYDQLDPEPRDWLAGLPPALWLREDIFLCHGTPSSDCAYWLERVNPDGSVRSATLDEIEAEAAGLEARLILCAHTHIPRVLRLRDGRVIVNPGSIGCPAYDDTRPVSHQMQTGTPNASYAIVEEGPSGWIVAFRSVPYDATAASALAASRGRPDWARALATGWLGA